MTALWARAALAAAFFVAGAVALAAPPEKKPGFLPIELSARPIAEFRLGDRRTRFGALEYRGGLDLGSDNPDFGSLSALAFAPDGKTIYAVTDNGFWFRARLVESGGRLTGIESAAIAPMLDSDGRPLIGKGESDAEGLRIVERNGREMALVSFEHAPSVAAFAAAPDLAMARRANLRLPSFVNNIRRNQGLEALAVAPSRGRFAGATLVIAERSLDPAGNHRGFVLSGPAAGPFYLRRVADYDVTDAAFLPDDDLLVLERRFALADGLGMRIRRIPAGAIRPGATVDGEVLLQSELLDQIDNMEGLAVRLADNGELLLTLVSDDNHSLLQRTLLLQFALPPAPPPALRPTTQ